LDANKEYLGVVSTILSC